MSGPKSGSFHLSEAPGFPTKVRPQNLKSTFSRDTFASLYRFESVDEAALHAGTQKPFSYLFAKLLKLCQIAQGV